MAEQREQRSPGSQRGLLRSYAALAVLRQAALSLRHYGIRCAHLYLRHSMVSSCTPLFSALHVLIIAQMT